MNLIELKNTLKQQAVPLDVAVENKLAYLMSDDVFNTENDAYILTTDDQNDDLAMIFEQTLEKTPSSEEWIPDIEETPQTKMKSSALSMSERIAALRGTLDLPQEYHRR